MSTKRPLAPHVQAAVAATAQPKAAAGARPAQAAHVQAVVAQARLQAPLPARPPAAVQPRANLPVPALGVSAGRAAVPPPPVHWNLASTAPGPPAVQAKTAPVLSRVAQPAKRQLETKGKELFPPQKRVQKIINYSENNEYNDRILDNLEKADTEFFAKKRQDNLEKYKPHLSKKPPKKGLRKIKYGKSGKPVDSYPISKDLMLKAYGEAMTELLDPTVFHINTPTEEGPLLQHFVVRQGHDYVLFPLMPSEDDVYKQEGKDGPAFADLALNADDAAEWLQGQEEVYGTPKKARIRVACDVNRMAGGRQPKVRYPFKYMAGAGGLTTFAAVIRADKGRVSKATKYIESILKEGGTDFGSRFGGENPSYIGTGKGKGRGPVGLRKKAGEDSGSESVYSDGE
ncbi:MAG TPA: hypothetical protein VKK31_27315 [Thermoanaerobaculia bacterium]|nr:hypothetical protein [Thermoanaerobaculia bacterium]